MTYLYPPSPESEVFSTPPTSPMPSVSFKPTRTLRGRPSKLLLDPSKPGSNSIEPSITPDDVSFQFTQPSEPTITVSPHSGDDMSSVHQDAAPMKSPCFVHSQLEKGASLVDWLKHTHIKGNINVAKSLGSPNHAVAATPPNGIPTPTHDGEDDDAHSMSLTRQLAETAVGVREMSKALGRARVHSDLQSILIITKARDNRLVQLTREIAIYLMQKKRPSVENGNRRIIVYVDSQLQTSKRFDVEGMEREYPEFFVPVPKRRSSNSSVVSSHTDSSLLDYKGAEDGQLRFWTADMCSRQPHLFDFVVTLGGDGTVLFTSWLFQRIVPPVLPFALGSLGFLTNFDFADHKAVMDAAIDTGIRVNLRMRFTCTVYRAVAPELCAKKRKAVKKAQTGEIWMKDLERDGWEALESGVTMTGASGSRDKEIMCFTTRPVESFEILNDLVVDRGPSPYVSLLELFGDEHHMTTVQADGLVVATPTGSTAYSLSAGGSLVHPEIPALLISPICPHTLSFRPMLLPDTMELRICVPYNSRSTAWASFDGRGRVELKQGDHIKVTASKYPFPTVCADKQSTDWFHAISRTLKWNERERQKSFVMIEEEPSKFSKSPKASTPPSGLDSFAGELNENDEEDENSEEEEEKYDIDDSTTAPNTAPNSTPTSAAPSKPSTPSGSRITSMAELAMTHFNSDTSGSPTRIDSSESTNGEIDFEVDGARDNIHSPKSLLHGAKSKIPKDRDVDSMLTPRPGVTAHPQEGRTPRPAVPNAMVQAQSHSGSRSRPSHPHGRRGHRASKSADFAAGNRAFACWGQDESDSNTDSEA